MSAPTPAPGDDRPREGYYPDPSIPGYVRYWNGAAWVPGTSRPAPSDGEPLPVPPGATAAVAHPVEETGPHFFDEEPPAAPAERPAQQDPEAGRHGARPEPATAWQADATRQDGLGAEQERRVAWGAPGQPDPRVPSEPAPRAGTAKPPEPAGQPEPGEDGSNPGTVTLRAVKPGDAAPGSAQPPTGEGTVTFRRPSGPARPAAGSTPAASPGAEGTMAIRAGGHGGAERGAPATPPQPTPPQASVPPQAATGRPAAPQASAPQASVPPQAAASQQAPAAPQPHVPQQGGAPAPVTSGPGGGSASWAQQVHQLAGSGPAAPGEAQPVLPWKPVTEDPFLAAARAQASARPAGLGRRFAARLIDTAVLAAVTGAAALPLGADAADHIDGKIDAAKLSGEKTTVWLLDGTTAGHLGIVLAVLLLFGVVYEALPTAKWGRTLGKKVCGIEVRDIEEHETPTLRAALRRWLVYSVPGVLVIGVVGVLWCLFDRPWRQCWHDKAAGTFVAG
ncbi:RDD family protein [Streptomyces alfalfae]|uniref:RDD family protein n=1 Tax=Streptomyces alfalfae TaxID=1642299 RepID=A0A7T4TYL6_9ACTN|nr:RDD family protein [Streptomyces alfalfae]QQC89522.1 RDD family protein [Streptomyces alfalfae]QUI31962.1 RDD family protein [Streptomyces alfalfae]